jgi:hypothetical protein
MDKSNLYLLLLALLCLGLSSFVLGYGWRTGTLYVRGTTVKRVEKPLQFWTAMLFYGGIPAGFGLVLLIAVLRHL